MQSCGSVWPLEGNEGYGTTACHAVFLTLFLSHFLFYLFGYLSFSLLRLFASALHAEERDDVLSSIQINLSLYRYLSLYPYIYIYNTFWRTSAVIATYKIEKRESSPRYRERQKEG